MVPIYLSHILILARRRAIYEDTPYTNWDHNVNLIEYIEFNWSKASEYATNKARQGPTGGLFHWISKKSAAILGLVLLFQTFSTDFTRL